MSAILARESATSLARNRAAAVAFVLLAAACRTPAPVTGAAPGTAPSVPSLTSGSHWRIDPVRSTILLYVYRDGPMAALGHNHVIVLQGVSGELQRAADPLRSVFWLRVPLDQVDIDDPARRAKAGADFSASVSDAARAGTRRNMLGEKLLDVARYPSIEVHSEGIERQVDGYKVRVRVRVHDNETSQWVPVTLSEDVNGLSISGEFSLRQSSLGLTPFSVLLGALRVADAMQVRFDLRADPPVQQGQGERNAPRSR